MRLSRTQVDRLGERLRRGDVSGDDLRLLDAYRLSFAEPYAEVVAVLRDQLGLAPTGRPAKSTKSIIDKLNRESARLSQIQDIAGCRVVTADLAEQNRVVEAIRERFDEVTAVDRRKHPSNGYRAVHVLVALHARRVEVQVRTALQHLWAELSEKLSDRFGIGVKYGVGAEPIRLLLSSTSALVALEEKRGELLASSLLAPEIVAPDPDLSDRVAQSRAELQIDLEETRTILRDYIARFTSPDV